MISVGTSLRPSTFSGMLVNVYSLICKFTTRERCVLTLFNTMLLQFHFVLNVAVGGTNGFIPDGYINRGGVPAFQKPWNNGDGYIAGMQNFFNARNNWKWTWDNEGDNNAMQIDYIRVYRQV